MKPGDLITAYHGGIHELIKVENNLAFYYQRFTAAGVKRYSKKSQCCSVDFCEPALKQKRLNSIWRPVE